MEGFLDPNEILNQIELRKNMMAAEFGCGSGGFAVPLAQRLEEGTLYAFDIQEEPLSALKGRAELKKISNIRTIQCDLEKPRSSALPDQFLDLVLIPNVLFQVEDKNALIKEAKRVLKKGAKLLIVDWLPESPMGPVEGRVSSEEVKKIAKELDLKLEKEFKAGDYHYGLIFAKP